MLMLVEVQNYFNDGANYQAKAVLASFSGKYYGRRSLERRKKDKNIE